MAELPVEAVHEAVTQSNATLRLVVIGLVTVAIMTLISVTVLAYARRPTPDAVVGIGSAAVGALSTLLARVGRLNGNGNNN